MELTQVEELEEGSDWQRQHMEDASVEILVKSP